MAIEPHPLEIKVSRCVLNGQMYDIIDYEKDYLHNSDYYGPNNAIVAECENKQIVLPIRGKVKPNYNIPGVYEAGCINFIIMPNENNIDDYIPTEIIDLNNTISMKEVLERKDIIARLDEPWITSPDNITSFQITDEDKPEMRCLKMALNKKQIDIDKYAPRFGMNYPNDKRQLKNTSATLNIIKRFCQFMDMEALLTLRDKNPNVPNPIGESITVSLNDIEEEEDE